MGTDTGYTAPCGEKHGEFFDGHFADHLMVFMFGEDLPVETNRVTLDPEVTDSSGLPATHVDYALHDDESRSRSTASTRSPRPPGPSGR